ncbi:hypothetical protein [Salinibacter ruber]|uniref:hypothetical protein n=1 Tax=Salinibacter ruber TaxID=146919 RepID=UPI0021687641|nr:hypothetical protein [Salinibacter ruber]MCS3642379.1 hypothetical protein [Salinibacter ruber]
MHVLTGASHVGDLLFAVKSFLSHYESPIALVIHGDPSVEADTAETIRHHFPEARLFLKDERDATVLPRLQGQGLARCRAFREANVFGERLVDTAVLSKGRIVINMDTDCLTFAPLDRLRSLVQKGVVTHIQDPNPQPFSVTDQEAERRFKVKPIRHFNAGLCAFPSGRLDLEQIEAWLSRPGYPMESHYAEQTILAALAALGKAEALPKKKYTFGEKGKISPRFVHYAGHYLSETRIAMRRDGQRKVLDHLREAHE